MIKNIVGIVLLHVGLATGAFGVFSVTKGASEGFYLILVGFILMFAAFAVFSGEKIKDTLQSIFTGIQF